MRRTPALVACLLALAVAPVARATPPPLHRSDGTFAVPPGVTAVVVDLDAGSATVRAGTGPGQVRTAWDVWQPAFSATVVGRTLRLTGRCQQRHDLAGPVSVTGSDPSCSVDVTVPVPAAVAVTVQADDVSVSGVRGDLSLTGLESVAADHIGPGALLARSPAGTVRVSTGRPRAADVEGSNDVALQSLTTGSLKAGSDTAGVSLADVEVRGPLAVDASSDVQAQGLSAQAAVLTSETGAVSLLRSRTDSLQATAASTVTLDTATSRVARLRAGSSTVRVLRSTLDDLEATGSDSVAVTDQRTPSRVHLTSDAAWVSLVVPPARYAVTTRTSNGNVTVEGITVDPRSPRTLEIQASTDISIT